MSWFLHALPNQIEQQVQLEPPRHAAWTLNRYQVGRLTEFAEPVYAKWYKSLFLGKPHGQDSFFVFNGNSILLTRSIRRVAGDWKLGLALYTHCQAFSWQYQSSFGAREFLPPRASQAPASGQASSSQGALAEDLRSSAVVRPAGGEGEEQRMSKKARAKDAKKARIQRLQEDMEGAEVPRLCEGHHPLHELCEVPKGWHGLSQTE